MMNESAETLIGVRQVRRDGGGVGGAILLTLLLAIVGFVIARNQGQQGSEWDLTVRSMFYASVCALPPLWFILRQPRSIVERILIGLWWPLKMSFMLYYYFSVWDVSHLPHRYLNYSDNLPWYEAGTRVLDYWTVHGMGLIPKDTLVILSINYPAASYFFGGIFYSFGRYLGPTLPWLSLFMLLSAAFSQRLMEQCGLPRAEAKVAFHLMLWSPALWLYTLLVQRDPLIIFTWLAIAYSTIRLFQRFSILNLAVLGAATIVLANLRAEYLYVELAWLAFVAANSLRKQQDKSVGTRVALLFIATTCAVLIGWGIWGGGSAWYVTKYDIGAGVEKQFDSYMQAASSGAGFYGRILSLGGVFLLPIILPFKLLIGLTAPFPWRFTTFELSVTQPFYSLESILRLSLFFFALRVALRWGSFSKAWSIETKLVLMLGALVGIAGLLGPLSEVRYLAPAIPFLVPMFATYAKRKFYWFGGILFAVVTITALQVLYFLFK